MNKVNFNAVITAFRRSGDRETRQDVPYSALLPVHGMPMLEWVVDALRKCSQVKTITVIGPDLLDELFCMRYVERRIDPLTATLQNLLNIFSSVSVSEADLTNYIIVPGEAVYLSESVLEDILDKFQSHPTDMAIPVVDPALIKDVTESHLSTVHLDGKASIAGILALTRQPGLIAAALMRLSQLHEKEDLFGDSGISIPVLAALENRFGMPSYNQQYLETDRYETVLSVLTKEELREAERKLPPPYKPRFSRVMIILNPKTGKGSDHIPVWLKKILGIRKRSLDKFESLEQYKNRIGQYLSEFGIRAEMKESKSSTDATSIARHCAEAGYDLVVAVGGDGTINSVVNGLAGSKTALGAIPLGTVNVYAIQLNIPMEIRSACQLIARGKVTTIDLGKTGDKYFTSLTGIGFDAYVVANANSRVKKILGAGAYLLTGIVSLIRYRFHTIRLVIDNQSIKRTGYLVLVGNGKFYTADMVFSPLARLDDGKLDVVIFRNKNIFSLLRYVWHLRKGNLTDLPDVEYYQGKEIEIEAHGHHYIHVDGEVYGHTPVKITVVPSALRVVC